MLRVDAVCLAASPFVCRTMHLDALRCAMADEIKSQLLRLV